jgi:hypothetical protein
MSQQALRDAVRIRDLIFAVFTEVDHAVLRAFCPSSAREPPEMVILGHSGRADGAVVRVNSWAMKAKLCGFHFNLDDGILQGLESQEVVVLDVSNESIASA